MLKRKAFLAVLTIMVLVLTACFQVATAPEPTEVSYAFYLTDKPTVEAEHLYMAIDSVSYQIAGEEGGFTTVSTDSTVVDLFEFAGDLLALGDADLEGTLTKIRLEVSAANVVTDEGTYGCDVPPDKVDVIVPEYEFAEELDVLIDFEAGASIHKTGGPSPSYKLRPVVKASIMVPEERIEIGGTVQDSSGTGLSGYIVALFKTEEPSTDSENILTMTVSHRSGGRWGAGDFRLLTTADDATHAVGVLDAETVEEGTSTMLIINAILDSTSVVLDSDKDGIVLTVSE
ncbi:MAG: hypothetical protein DRP27_07620 [Thermotogae bacterium]|nr:MAG: hypothetical protein DRP27_07620 [Thermotogota bacterium]